MVSRRATDGSSDNDREDAAVVLSPGIGLERLGGADERAVARMHAHVPVEAAVQVDVVGCGEPSRTYRESSSLKLVKEVSLAVLAVVDEEVDFAEALEEIGESATTRTPEIRPARPQRGGDCCSDLTMQVGPPGRRSIDAPKPPRAVCFERLQNEAAREAASDAGFHDLGRPEVPCNAPDATDEAWFPV